MESQRLTDTGSLSAPFGGNKQQPPKTVWLALGLFLAGSLLIIIGVSLYFTDPGAHGRAQSSNGTFVQPEGQSLDQVLVTPEAGCRHGALHPRGNCLHTRQDSQPGGVVH